MPHKAGTQPSLSPITDCENSGACLHGSVVRRIRNLHARPMKNGYALGALRPRDPLTGPKALNVSGSIHNPIIGATTSSLTGKKKAARIPLES